MIPFAAFRPARGDAARPAKRVVGLLAGALLALVHATSSAHHPISGKFDMSSSMTLRGTVTYVDWRNPHAHVFMNVEGPDGLLNWAVELESPIALEASGWRDDTVVPGAALVVEGPSARDGTRQVWGASVKRAENGHSLFQSRSAGPTLPLSPRPPPRWPNGQVALGATATTASGYWGYPSEKALVEEGVDVAMDEYGLLANPGDAARVAPMQPWALALYRHRQARQLRDDPTYLNCKPPGGPRQYQSDLGLQLIEDRERERIFVLLGSGNHNYRIIYLDGREQVGQVGGDDDNPLYYGRSVGQWERDADGNDTLVVDTRGFNEDFWFTNGGLPHTNRLRLVERFSRPDFDTLRYEVTIDDPGAYTRPWTASWMLRWVGGQDLPSHFCQNNRP